MSILQASMSHLFPIWFHLGTSWLNCLSTPQGFLKARILLCPSPSCSFSNCSFDDCFSLYHILLLWATCYSGRCPYPWQWGSKQMIFNVPSNHNPSPIILIPLLPISKASPFCHHQSVHARSFSPAHLHV